MAMYYDPEQRPIFRQIDSFNAGAVRARLPQSAHLHLPYTRRYSRPVFEFLRTLTSPTTNRIVQSLRSDRSLPEGPEVEVHDVSRSEMVARLAMIVSRWVEEGFCRPEQILILAPHQKAKTSLAESSQVAAWPLVDHLDRAPGQLNLLSVRRAKGLDSLGVILVDFPRFERLAEGQDRMDFFMGASRARQLLAVLHLEDTGSP